MKRSREFFLWAFFLALCFWAGYLKGFLPLTFKHSLFVKGAVRIYNACPFDFPRPFVLELEEELGQRVEVVKIRNWDDLQAKMVTKVGAHLLFAPAHWASDLTREGVIVGLSYIQPKIEKYVAPDFISIQDKSSQVLPLYWTVTKFVTANGSFGNDDLATAQKDKNLAEVHLYPDADLIAVHMKTWRPAGKDIEGFNFRSPPAVIQKNAVWEVPLVTNIPDSRVLTTSESQALVVYGLMIPKNSPNRRVSYRVMEKLVEIELQQKILGSLPLGTTLRDDDTELNIEKDQRAGALRDLKLNELIILDRRHAKEFLDLQNIYNFIF
jgi:hypothetical protein